MTREGASVLNTFIARPHNDIFRKCFIGSLGSHYLGNKFVSGRQARALKVSLSEE